MNVDALLNAVLDAERARYESLLVAYTRLLAEVARLRSEQQPPQPPDPETAA